MNAISISTTQTMSTREVAELIEKQHSHIKVSAERLAEKGVIGTLATREFIHNGNRYTEYLLNKRDSLILVAQNCPEFTARIVDRWQELERQAAQGFTIPQNMGEALRLAADEHDKRVVAEQGRVAAESALALAAPKAEALDRIARADGSLCITSAAKDLQVRPKDLFAWLQQHQWIYRRPGGANWLGYQDRIQQGLLEHKVTTVSSSDGSEKIAEQVRITPKGLSRLAQALGQRQAA